MHRLDVGIPLGPGDRPAFADVGHRGDLGSSFSKQFRQIIRRRVGRENHDALAGQHTEPLEVRADRPGEHHAGAVVVGEGDRTLVRAGREDHAAGAHVPEGVASRSALVHDRVPVVVEPQRRGVRQNGHAVTRGGSQPIAFDQEDAVAALHRFLHHRVPTFAAPDDQDLDVYMAMDGRLRRRGIEGQDADPRPSGRHEAVNQIDHRRRDDRLEPWLRYLDERARLFDAGGNDPPEPAEDRRAAHHVGAVRQQRARERVPLETLELATVEREPDRARPVDPRPALREPSPRHAGGSSSSRYVATNRCVAVSRTALNQRRHPAVWNQRSRNGPFGLSRMKR